MVWVVFEKENHTVNLSELSVPGIYAIEHVPTRRAYVGQAMNIRVKWERHRRDLRNGRHDNKPMQRAWTKYGEDAFTIRVVVDLSHIPEDQLDALLRSTEIIEMASRKNLYNRAQGGHGRSPISAETRKRISEKRRAMWADPVFRERRAVALAKSMLDPVMQATRSANIKAAMGTDEYRAKRSAKSKEMWQDPEFRAKRNKSLNETWADPERRKRHGEAISASWDTRRAKAK
jgi:group I intron endonuclease